MLVRVTKQTRSFTKAKVTTMPQKKSTARNTNKRSKSESKYESSASEASEEEASESDNEDKDQLAGSQDSSSAESGSEYEESDSRNSDSTSDSSYSARRARAPVNSSKTTKAMRTQPTKSVQTSRRSRVTAQLPYSNSSSKPPLRPIKSVSASNRSNITNSKSSPRSSTPSSIIKSPFDLDVNLPAILDAAVVAELESSHDFYNTIEVFRGFKRLEDDEKQKLLKQETKREAQLYISLKPIFNLIQTELDLLTNPAVVQNPLHFRDLLLYFFETDHKGRLRRLALTEPQFLLCVLSILRRIRYGPAELNEIRKQKLGIEDEVQYVLPNDDLFSSDEEDEEFQPSPSPDLTDLSDSEENDSDSGLEISSSGSSSSSESDESVLDVSDCPNRKRIKSTAFKSSSSKKRKMIPTTSSRHVSFTNYGKNVHRSEISWPPALVSPFPTHTRPNNSFALKVTLNGQTVLNSYTFTNGKNSLIPPQSTSKIKKSSTSTPQSTSAASSSLTLPQSVSLPAASAFRKSSIKIRRSKLRKPLASSTSTLSNSKITNFFNVDSASKYQAPVQLSPVINDQSSQAVNKKKRKTVVNSRLSNNKTVSEEEEDEDEFVSEIVELKEAPKLNRRNSSRVALDSLQANKQQNHRRDNLLTARAKALSQYSDSDLITSDHSDTAVVNPASATSATADASNSTSSFTTHHHHHHHHHALSNTAIKRRHLRPAEFMSSGISYNLVGTTSSTRSETNDWFMSLIQSRDDLHLFVAVIVYLAIIGVTDDEHIGDGKQVVFFNALITRAQYGEQAQARTFRTSTNKKSMSAQMMYKFDAMSLELVQRDLLPPLPLPTFAQLDLD